MIDVDQLFIGKQAGFSDARPAERRSGDFRDLPERWRPSEAERNQAAFMVCRWLNHSEDTEADRREGFEWTLAKRCAFDWLRRHLGNGNAFAIDDNRRPCACCAQRTNDTGRCLAVDRRELIGRAPYLPLAFMLLRCVAFLPLPGDPDQRPGRLRWPGLVRIDEATCKDAAPDASWITTVPNDAYKETEPARSCACRTQ